MLLSEFAMVILLCGRAFSAVAASVWLGDDTDCIQGNLHSTAVHWLDRHGTGDASSNLAECALTGNTKCGRVWYCNHCDRVAAERGSCRDDCAVASQLVITMFFCAFKGRTSNCKRRVGWLMCYVCF
jgi:hypothetical protein